MPSRRRHLYQFGDFHIDINERALFSVQKPLALPPKVFDTLLLLVENSGYILEKTEILEKIWPDTFVEEGNLAIYISQIRKALGDNAGQPSFIETIPKRGYRFIAPVTEIKDSDEPQLIEQPALNFTSTGEAQLTVAAATKVSYQTSPVNHSNQLNIDQIESALDNDATPQLIANSQPFEPSIEREIERAVTSTVVTNHNSKIKNIFIISLAVIVVLALSVTAFRRYSRPTAPFAQIELTRLSTNGQMIDAAISPDGKYTAYIQRLQTGDSLWLRQIDSTSAMVLVSPSSAQLRAVAFNPAGSKIYYLASAPQQSLSQLYEIPFLGGTPLKIASDIDSRISFSPDSQRLAFVRGNPARQQSELIVFNLNGSGEKQLAVRPQSSPFSLDGPAWSPDGRMIAIATGTVDLGNPNMMVIAIDVAEGTSKQITQQPWSWIGAVNWQRDNRGLIMPGWRQDAPIFTDQLWYLSYPDGQYQQITHDLDRYSIASVAANSDALITIQHNRQSRLWITSLTATDRTTSQSEIQISNGFGDIYSDWFGLSWTADGRILFGSTMGGNNDIWLLNPSDQTQQQLTRDPRADLTPSISQDNRYLIFCSYATGRPHIFGMDLDGGNLKQLTDGSGEVRPDISPDGQWFVYTSMAADKRTIWRGAINGAAPVQLSPDSGFHPVISPDGKSIAYLQADPQYSNFKIVVIAANSGQPIQIFSDVAMTPGSLIEWLPDNSGIAFIKTENGVANIWSQPINGGAAVKLTNFTTDQIYRFAFSVDGTKLACERGTVVSDLILIKEKR